MKTPTRAAAGWAVFLLLGAQPACAPDGRRANGDRRSGDVPSAAESQGAERGPRGGRRGQRGRGGWGGRGQGPRTGTARSDAAPPPAEPVRLSEEEAETVEIETVAVELRGMKAQLQVMGKLLAPQSRKAIVSYAFPARIAEVDVSIGMWVERGQPVITLQSEEVGEAKSAFFRARADEELAQANLEREQRLFDRGVGARKSLLAAEAERKVARANRDAAEKKLHVLGFSEDQVQVLDESHQVHPVITLFAPITGRVIENNAVLGDMVDQSTEILTIMDPTVLWVDAEIFERDIARVHPGQDVELSVPAYPGETFGGRISYVGDVLKEDTRTVTVRTEVENRGHRLKPGMFADVRISLNGGRRTLSVPAEAVLDDQHGRIVFVAVDDGYIPRWVETGAQDDGYVEILGGLAEDERVVTAGSFQLKSKLHEEANAAHVH